MAYSIFSRFATPKYRWLSLIAIALGLAIVIIDNTVLNVSIPYILRDLHASFTAIQWVISGYALFIAAMLITMGRLGDLYGRKRIFLTGAVVFAIGSSIASISPNSAVLFLGEAMIEAVGASMMLPSALSLIAATFQGRERAIAFGIWGSVAGASASVGPLLGGFLTTFYTWRWSFRINVLVVLITLIGSVFIMESKGEGERAFDWTGMFLSGLGLGTVIFGVIEGQTLGWLSAKAALFGWTPPFSPVPLIILVGLSLLFAFVLHERWLEAKGRHPLLRMSIFSDRGFTIGLVLLCLMAFGQISTFFVLPLFMENALHLSAFKTGVLMLASSISIFLVGSLAGYIASRTRVKYVVVTGGLVLCAGYLYLISSLHGQITSWTLVGPLIVFGTGFGLGSSQLNNVIISSAPLKVAGEAGAMSTTMRQVGASLGIAIIGSVFAMALLSQLVAGVHASGLPSSQQQAVVTAMHQIDLESGNLAPVYAVADNAQMQVTISESLAGASRVALWVSFCFIALATLLMFFLPHIEERHGGA